MTWIDTHAHLFEDSFQTDINQVIDRSLVQGVEKIYMPNLSYQSFEDMWSLSQKYPKICFPCIGIHPCYVGKDYAKDLENLWKKKDPKSYLAVGEIGLDSYSAKESLPQQIEAFHMQCKWALSHKLPVLLHSRGEGILQILIDSIAQNYPKLQGVFHCFLGSPAQAQQIRDMGFLLGIGGMLSYTHGKELRNMLSPDLLESIVLETDAPYLPPSGAPARRNEPANIPLIAKQIAKRTQIPIEEIAKITTQNAEKLFQKKV
ncbi:MAG: TatD family hydrolase [Cytophagales bacterium]|nr:TatD family hydrolase [Cytophagales bacterium]